MKNELDEISFNLENRKKTKRKRLIWLKKIIRITQYQTANTKYFFLKEDWRKVLRIAQLKVEKSSQMSDFTQ